MSEILTINRTPEKPAETPEVPAQAASENANELTTPFKPGPVAVELGGEQYNLIYDLNAFCEMETIYESVDAVIAMLLGTSQVPDLNKVAYQGKVVPATDITVDGQNLAEYIKVHSAPRKAKHSDTLNLLWLGVLHDHTIFDDIGNVKGYTISKAKLGSMVTLTNLRDVNSKIVTAILRDLMPAVAEAAKNAAPAAAPTAE